MRTSQAERIYCVIMRGGTSRAIFVKESDLPKDRIQRDRVILGLFGSPDKRQIDGLGGADVLTSKFAMIGPPSRDDADVDYTFVQVGIANPTLDYRGNCGNISAAVGPYAIEEGLVRAVQPITKIRIHNTNTNKILIAHVPVVDGEVAIEGDTEIAGVPGTGAEILLDYSKTVGAVTGKFFPTGNLIDELDVPGVGRVRATLSDVANPVVYIHADDQGLSGIESPDEFDNDRELNHRLEMIRCQAAVKFGMTEAAESATRECSLFPLLTVVQSPRSYLAYGSDVKIDEDQVDIVVRMQALQQSHKAYAGTGTANLGATAMVPGTIVNEALSRNAKESGTVRFGHPSGVATVDARVVERDGAWTTTEVGYKRTARRVMEGYAFVRRDRLNES